MKISVSSYSFASLVSQGLLDADSIIDKAKSMGFEAIEFAGLYVPNGVKPIDYAKSLKEKASDIGIEISCYSVGADFLNNDLDKEIERVKKEVDIAYELGAGMMRHDVCYRAPDRGYKSFEKNVDILIKGAKAITEYAGDKGIVTMTENHGFYAQDCRRVEMLVDGVNSPNYGVLVDIGNFLCADEDPVVASSILKPYVKNIHCKDFYFKSGREHKPQGPGWFVTRGGNYLKGATVGDGVVPVVQCINVLRSEGYDGYITIEYEGTEDVAACIAAGKKFIEENI